MLMQIPKWDLRMLQLAEQVASWSRDPSTKAGAVIVRPDKTIASVGFNGFARGMLDDEALYADREVKYQRVIHCEMNAILHAREPLTGYTLFTFPFLTCDRCAVHVIQSGINHVVSIEANAERLLRWKQSFEQTRGFYEEAGVQCIEYANSDYEAFTSSEDW